MKRTIFILGIIIPLTISAANLEIRIDGIKNNKGSILLEIYTDEVSFKNHEGVFQRYKNIKINDRTAKINISLDQGQYALIVYHDENQNSEVDLDSYKQPVEGWGTSHFHKKILSFKDRALSVKDSDLTETITLLYPRKVALSLQDIRNKSGYLMLRVYDSEENFLKPDRAFLRDDMIKITGNEVQFELMLLPGKYAFNFFHDENGNGKVDRYFFGMPKEGYGNSRGARALLGPPIFDDAVVSIEQGSTIYKQKVILGY